MVVIREGLGSHRPQQARGQCYPCGAGSALRLFLVPRVLPHGSPIWDLVQRLVSLGAGEYSALGAPRESQSEFEKQNFPGPPEESSLSSNSPTMDDKRSLTPRGIMGHQGLWDTKQATGQGQGRLGVQGELEGTAGRCRRTDSANAKKPQLGTPAVWMRCPRGLLMAISTLSWPCLEGKILDGVPLVLSLVFELPLT